MKSGRGVLCVSLLLAGPIAARTSLAQTPETSPSGAASSDAPPAPAPPPVTSASEPAAAASSAPPPAAPPADEKAEKKHEKAEKKHEKPVSPLVPAVDTHNAATKPMEPKLTMVPGKGLTFTSTDGDFELQMKIRGQILATFENERDEGERLSGVQIRRARVAFQGHWFGKHNKYKMELAVSPRDDAMRDGVTGTAPLLDWYMTFDYVKAATIVVGQYKVPYSRQRVVSSGSLQFVDRSIVQGEFNLDRNVGIDVRSTSLLDGHLHYFAGVYGGEGRNAFELNKNNMVYLARVEVLPFGHFNDYVEADFERTGPRVSLGAAYSYNTNSRRNQGPLGRAPRDEGTTTFHHAEADVLLKIYGLSVTGEVFYRKGARKQGDATDDTGARIPTEPARSGYGFFGQAGYLLPHTMFEVLARYGNMRKLSDSSLANRQEVGGGLSYYFARHSFKLQADYFRLWGDTGLAKGIDQVRVQLETGF